jgi:hypothetical protein
VQVRGHCPVFDSSLSKANRLYFLSKRVHSGTFHVPVDPTDSPRIVNVELAKSEIYIAQHGVEGKDYDVSC